MCVWKSFSAQVLGNNKVILAILLICLCKLIVPQGRECKSIVLIQSSQHFLLCSTERAELHGSSLTCFAWHRHCMQLFLSSCSLTPDLTQAGTQLPCPYGKSKGMSRCPYVPQPREAKKSYNHVHYTHTRRLKFCVCHPQPHKTMGLGTANGIHGESLEFQSLPTLLMMAHCSFQKRQAPITTCNTSNTFYNVPPHISDK